MHIPFYAFHVFHIVLIERISFHINQDIESLVIISLIHWPVHVINQWCCEKKCVDEIVTGNVEWEFIGY